MERREIPNSGKILHETLYGGDGMIWIRSPPLPYHATATGMWHDMERDGKQNYYYRIINNY